MKKLYSIILICAILTMTTMLCASAVAGNSVGPAPNSGDGIPDGSGLEQPDSPGPGPAPNAGDGVPDGSGF